MQILLGNGYTTYREIQKAPYREENFEKMAEIFNTCNIPVLCEGIETSKEAHFVQECGISYMQGFYYGRPVPFDIFEKKYMIPQPAYLAFHAQ